MQHVTIAINSYTEYKHLAMPNKNYTTCLYNY